MHLIEAADRTPSGVPPMPQRRSTGDSGCTASNAADTSPCEMKRMRAPARRISSTASSCRSRFSIITVTSRTSTPFSLAIRPTVSVNGRSRSSRCAKAGCAAIFSMYTAGPGSNIVPRSDIAITANARGEPSAARVVPSRGSTAMSVCGGDPSPMCSPLYSIGASSFSPSPITTTPSICTVSSISRIASTAAPSAFSFSPSPTHRAAASAPYSVTRTNSMARLRSGRAGDCSGMTGSDSGGRGFHAFGLSPEAPERYEKCADDRDEIAVLEVDVDGVLVAAARTAEDDPVEQDQRGDHDPDDHRDLARAPAQVVAAGDDVREHERRYA